MLYRSKSCGLLLSNIELTESIKSLPKSTEPTKKDWRWLEAESMALSIEDRVEVVLSLRVVIRSVLIKVNSFSLVSSNLIIALSWEISSPFLVKNLTWALSKGLLLNISVWSPFLTSNSVIFLLFTSLIKIFLEPSFAELIASELILLLSMVSELPNNLIVIWFWLSKKNNPPSLPINILVSFLLELGRALILSILRVGQISPS